MKQKSKRIVGTLAALAIIVSIVMVSVPAEKEKFSLVQYTFSTKRTGDTQYIPEGSIIYHSNDGITTVYDREGNIVLKARDSETARIVTPLGVEMPVTYGFQGNTERGSKIIYDTFTLHTRDRMTISSDKALIRYKQDGSLLYARFYEKGWKPNPDIVIDYRDQSVQKRTRYYEGWIEESYDADVSLIDEFNAYWRVPSSPPSPNLFAFDFLFNAVQSSAGDKIVQPVLEWNYGNTHRWTASAWWVQKNPQAYGRGTPINVYYSDVLKGCLEYGGYGQPHWQITIWKGSNYSYVGAPPGFIGHSHVGVYTALEGYKIQNDNDVPGDATFYSMTFYEYIGGNPSRRVPISVTWKGHVVPQAKNYLTGLDVKILSQPDKVKLYTAN